MKLRPAQSADAASIARIYNHYVLNTVVTFEEEPVSGEVMAGRLAETREVSLPWIVAEQEGDLVGYAYASSWKGRRAYRHSVETTVYLDQGCAGHGIGSSLYLELLTQLRALGMHTAIGGIALPNDASVALHEKLGFVHLGTFRQVGFKQGRWIDVGYWQVLL
ncbi:MAG: GNAT family N-acetyltransferase [Thermoanaerobaculia bacterium]|nr:GNAT family N-acetyltransferase [Thermoanaerobaculia bacterium]